jgi:hypothetical protein
LDVHAAAFAMVKYNDLSKRHCICFCKSRQIVVLEYVVLRSATLQMVCREVERYKKSGYVHGKLDLNRPNVSESLVEAMCYVSCNPKAFDNLIRS